MKKLPPPTTTKIPSDMHAKLLRASKKTGVRKAQILRLCVDVGLPKVLLLRHRGVEGVGLLLTGEQLAEMRELYRSAVTDSVHGLERLTGAEFVAEAEKRLAKLPEGERIARFLSVYAQLF